ncbi:TIR domain-containing protein [Leucothrix mucor]|uniref:TIR domain-containing protein n=1 Tax=Leucothrix mucor TaxID=45248 RepID=UPI0003B67664|nr:TIR domain-containing protein [Leucothrix mucor]
MPTKPRHIFLSHASADDEFVALLRKKLEDHGLEVWVDSRNLRGGSKLSPEIEEAIRTAQHFLVVISPKTINSDWVFDEIEIAEQVEKERPNYRAIPLMLPGITPKALKRYFSEEPAGEPIELEVGKLDEQLPHILAALGQRAPDHDLATAQEVANKPIAELLLELTEPTLTCDESGKEILSARAEIRYIPPDLSKEREVNSRAFRFTAPIGQNEQYDIRWYLEQYLIWPVGSFREQAETTEAKLPEWGKALYNATLGQVVCREPVTAWQQARGDVERRFSVQVDKHNFETDQDAQTNANEAASRLQSLPWELLHDDAYLSDGANPVRIRRRLPNFKHQPPSSAELPIRILLLSPRPEEKGVSYIDHRASALPLVQAVETLGDLVELTVLSPPTLPALEKELHRAREAKKPYHVLHFDGHGVYDRQFGLGALCFEHPQDDTLLEGRRSQLVYAKASQNSASANQTSAPPQSNLANLLKDFRIPLVFLEACQTAQTEADPNASVAASLLDEGVTSVVAMSHSVLVETARRFVTEFYQSLALGQQVGTAMLAGQKTLMRDTYRLPIAGAGDLHLQDWFVPILYQEQHDPQLFAWIPSATAQKMQAQQRQTRLGRLPEPPPHAFIGRSRDLLKAERLLEHQPYVVIRGQGGAGKTTLAVELANWLVKSRRFDRCAFVSVEEYTHDRAVTEVLLQQLVNANHNLAVEYAGDIDQALQAIRRTLENDRTLIVVDNMESLLADETNKQAVLDVLAKLPEAKLLFTTREPLLEPFHHKAREIELGALELSDAKALVMQVMNQEGLSLRHDDTGNTPQEVNDLVNSVGCHARALVLLARELAQRGVTATTANVREIMQALEQRYPGQRENSLFASVELSLRRLSPEAREQIVGLAVFQDGGNAITLPSVMGSDAERMTEVVNKLIEVGLAQAIGDYGYVRLDPALPTYLGLLLTYEQCAEYDKRWQEAMGELVEFLYQQRPKDMKLATQLTQLELPNLMHYLQRLMEAWNNGSVTDSVVVDKIISVEQLLEYQNQAQELACLVSWRNQVAQSFREWGVARFEHERMTIERLLQREDIQGAYIASRALYKQCNHERDWAYPGADYDLAMASKLHGQVLKTGGASEEALLYLQEARQRFEALGQRGEMMAISALSEKGDCLQAMGQLKASEVVYIEARELAAESENMRQIAIIEVQLATLCRAQRRYADALKGFQQALDLFHQSGEPEAVANIFHQIGMTHKELGDFELAEQAYRQSIVMKNQLGKKAGEAASLGELGNLYASSGRQEQALGFYQQAAGIYATLGNLRYEGAARTNVATMLVALEQYDEARLQLLRAIRCQQGRGSDIAPWITFAILHNLEQLSGNPQCAYEARQKALNSYLVYRRGGGENHSGVGRLALSARQAIQQGNTAGLEQVISSAITNYAQENKIFLHKLRAIIKGERDLVLVEDEYLRYDMAAELIILLEALSQ